MSTDWVELFMQRVRIAVEFVDGLHPLLILLLAFFLSTQTRSHSLTKRYATLASHLACCAFFTYLSFHYLAADLDDAWAVAVYFGRGVLVFQIVLALLTLFQHEILTPFELLKSFKQAAHRLPAAVVRLREWVQGIFPPPEPLPVPPPPTEAELRERAVERFDETYQHKLKLVGRTRLSRIERKAIREQAKRRYLRQLRGLIDE